MPGRSVLVVQEHRLDMATARARLKAMVNSPRTDARIKTGSFSWDEPSKTFTVELIAYGKTVKATALLAPGMVTVTTNKIDGFGPVVAFAVWRAEVEVKAMLEEALSP